MEVLKLSPAGSAGFTPYDATVPVTVGVSVAIAVPIVATMLLCGYCSPEGALIVELLPPQPANKPHRHRVNAKIPNLSEAMLRRWLRGAERVSIVMNEADAPDWSKPSGEIASCGKAKLRRSTETTGSEWARNWDLLLRMRNLGGKYVTLDGCFMLSSTASFVMR